MSTADTTISVDRGCIHCGYNLRGLLGEGQCPECGNHIGDSLRGDFLEHADPRWLGKLRFGCALKFWNIVLGGLVGLLGGLLVALAFPQAILQGLGLVGSGLGIWASFAITAQEPRISLQEDSVTLRKAIRICVVASVASGLLSNMLMQGFVSNPVAIGVTVLAAVLQLAGLVSFFGELVYLRRFALRVPDTWLARSTRIVQWGGAITIALGIVMAALFAMLSGAFSATAVTTGSGGPQVIGTIGGSAAVFAGFYVCGMIAAVVVFGIWYLSLLVKYRRAFAKASLAAQTASASVDSKD